MKFILPTHEIRVRAAAEWRPWFAFLPVRVSPEDVRWLEWVERRYVRSEKFGQDMEWQHRAANVDQQGSSGK